jgi:hypothetical protein
VCDFFGVFGKEINKQATKQTKQKQNKDNHNNKQQQEKA